MTSFVKNYILVFFSRDPLPHLLTQGWGLIKKLAQRSLFRVSLRKEHLALVSRGFFQHTLCIWRIKGKDFCIYYLGEKLVCGLLRILKTRVCFIMLLNWSALVSLSKTPEHPQDWPICKDQESYITRLRRVRWDYILITNAIIRNWLRMFMVMVG